MFSFVAIFIIGVLVGIFGTLGAINKHREYIAGVSRELSERERKFAEKRAEFEREWSDGSRASRRRFRMSESGDKPVDRCSS
ncbi:putative membrane protein [Salmonella phage phagemcphageface]|uniref:Putative membrane protein n=1 Tax=Salmonella phage phagemcphageface TaxID=2713311 RepID=A0A6G8RCF4_9CAUD|nr:putative membrane protein [Salmonella phage phagemcphageface]